MKKVNSEQNAGNTCIYEVSFQELQHFAGAASSSTNIEFRCAESKLMVHHWIHARDHDWKDLDIKNEKPSHQMA